jgi:hypothetical protein
MAARIEQGSTKGLYLAAEAGNNGKSHNHNDVGNFIVYANGEPAIIDVGVETYTAKTFGPHRYELWTMQSAFHNCPTIDGVMQSPGRQFAAAAVTCSPGELHMDIAGAYPQESKLKSWQRGIKLDRATNQIEINDTYALTQSAREITLTLMTPCKVTQESGYLALENKVRVAYDPSLIPAIEQIKLDDANLKRVWGDRVYRILLKAQNPPQSAQWKLHITQA